MDGKMGFEAELQEVHQGLSSSRKMYMWLASQNWDQAAQRWVGTTARNKDP